MLSLTSLFSCLSLYIHTDVQKFLSIFSKKNPIQQPIAVVVKDSPTTVTQIRNCIRNLIQMTEKNKKRQRNCNMNLKQSRVN